jgi:hypothetical protein
MFKTKITPILAATALVVAVFGSTPLGHAAGNLILSRNSVGATQLKQGAVTGAKLRKNAVTSLKVKDGSLLATDFKAGQLPAGAPGPQGAKGAQGPKGDKGDAGPAGISGVELVVGPESIVDPGQFGGAIAKCPTGKKVLGGGGGSEGNITISNSGPSTDAQWGINATNNEAFPASVYAYAVCAKVG